MIQIQLQQQDPSAAHSDRAEQYQGLKAFGDDGLTFGDVIDMINPLQHIPIVSHIYRKLTGDQIDPAIRIAGGALFGGPLGAALSAVSVAVGEALKGGEEAAAVLDDDTQLAHTAAEPPPPPIAPNPFGFVKVASSSLKVRESPVPTEAVDSKPKTTAQRAHRGGWMIAYAYGAQTPAADTERNEETKRLIDIAV